MTFIQLALKVRKCLSGITICIYLDDDSISSSVVASSSSALKVAPLSAKFLSAERCFERQLGRSDIEGFRVLVDP